MTRPTYHLRSNCDLKHLPSTSFFNSSNVSRKRTKKHKKNNKTSPFNGFFLTLSRHHPLEDQLRFWMFFLHQKWKVATQNPWNPAGRPFTIWWSTLGENWKLTSHRRKMMGWKSLNCFFFWIFLLGKGTFFAGRSFKLSGGSFWPKLLDDDDFRRLISTKAAHSKFKLELCNANLQKHEESQPLKGMISPEYLQHSSAKPFVMIAACILTNLEK